MRKFIFILGFVFYAMVCNAVELVSPSGELKLNVSVNEGGNPIYSLSFKNQLIINDSRLGFLSKEAEMQSNFDIKGVHY